MKVGGKPLVGHAKHEITLYRGSEQFTVTITALPVGWYDEMRNRKLIPPKPPEVLVKDADGRHVKLPNKQLQTKQDLADPTYQKAAAVWQSRYYALAVCDLLREDETVTWGDENNVVEPPDDKTGTPKEWEDFADKILMELALAGFTDTDIEQIITLGTEIASGTNVEEALKHFLSSRDSLKDPDAAS